MNDSSSPTYSPASTMNGDANPSTCLADSRGAAWDSVYLRHGLSGAEGEFEPKPTPDHMLSVMLKGEFQLTAIAGRRTRIAHCGIGAIGITPGGECNRMLWRSGGRHRSFESADLYLPHTFILEAADHYRRAGHTGQGAPPMILAFDDPALTAMVSAMVRAMHAGAPDLYAESAAHWIAVHLLAQTSPWRQRITDGRHAGDFSDARLMRVIEFMHDNLSRPISLDELASEAAISRFHFARLFRRRTGETPVGYLTRLRLEAACRLLSSTDLPIGHVAAACGYPQPSNFDTAFRRRYGRTPKQARSSTA